MTHLPAVQALDTRIVSWERALAALVALGITIAASNLAWVSAVLLSVAVLATVMACTTDAATLRAVTRKVTNWNY
jgi:hypothetical protein